MVRILILGHNIIICLSSKVIIIICLSISAANIVAFISSSTIITLIAMLFYGFILLLMEKPKEEGSEAYTGHTYSNRSNTANTGKRPWALKCNLPAWQDQDFIQLCRSCYGGPLKMWYMGAYPGVWDTMVVAIPGAQQKLN